MEKNKPNWDEAPEGATHWGPKSESGWVEAFYKKSPEGKWLISTGDAFGGRWHGNASLNEDWPERLASLVKHPTAWTGSGLPPVGTVCEAWHMGSEQGVVEVRYSGECMVLWNVRLKHEQCSASENYTFKAIRTPEQIAAEERELAIKDMAWLTNWPAAASTISVCASLYDAGYRKK